MEQEEESPSFIPDWGKGAIHAMSLFSYNCRVFFEGGLLYVVVDEIRRIELSKGKMQQGRETACNMLAKMGVV